MLNRNKLEKIDRLNKVINISDELDSFTLIPFGYPYIQKEQDDRFDTYRIHYI